MTANAAEAPRLSPEQSAGIEAAVRQLRDGRAGRDAALEALTAAGFSGRTAEKIVAAVTDALHGAPRPARAIEDTSR